MECWPYDAIEEGTDRGADVPRGGALRDTARAQQLTIFSASFDLIVVYSL